VEKMATPDGIHTRPVLGVRYLRDLGPRARDHGGCLYLRDHHGRVFHVLDRHDLSRDLYLSA
jgi:hypothetical protein